jgi:hypothetical protein
MRWKNVVKIRIAILSVLSVNSGVFAEEILREFPWGTLKQQGALSAGQVLPADSEVPFEQLMVHSADGETKTVTVLTVESPDVTSPMYSISGIVRHQDVEGEAYLETLNHFPPFEVLDQFQPAGVYHSRTMSQTGPQKHLQGSSGWRSFALPFYVSDGSGRAPEKIEVNVVFPGRGTVYLGPVRLAQFSPGENPLVAAEQWRPDQQVEVPPVEAGHWWSNRQAGLYGGISGALLGCVGALIGTLVSKGRGRRLVLVLLRVIFTVGVLAVAATLFAVTQSQPYAVCYPLLIIGGTCVLVSAGLLPGVRKRYEELELRRTTALDASSVDKAPISSVPDEQ